MQTNPRRVLCLLLVPTLLLISVCADDSGEPAQDASSASVETEPGREVITGNNLLAKERFWPYRVGLTQPLAVAGRDQPLPAGLVGVLIRVEASGLPRIDFSTRGKHEVALEKTDLLERANRIHRGEMEKPEPIFIHAIKSRMLDSGSDPLAPLPTEVAEGRPGFLGVFADPRAEGFSELASALAPLRDRHGVMTILFPQGTHPDPEVRDRLRSLEWTVPFVYDYLSEPYTHTLLVEGTPIPFTMLQTNEGRVLFQGPWSADASGLIAALDEAFGATSIGSSVADLERAH